MEQRGPLQSFLALTTSPPCFATSAGDVKFPVASFFLLAQPNLLATFIATDVAGVRASGLASRICFLPGRRNDGLTTEEDLSIGPNVGSLYLQSIGEELASDSEAHSQRSQHILSGSARDEEYLMGCLASIQTDTCVTQEDVDTATHKVLSRTLTIPSVGERPRRERRHHPDDTQ